MRASFSADEVAAMHGVSASKIRKLVASGELARVPNLGRTVRIPHAALVEVFGPIPAHVLDAFEREGAALIPVTEVEPLLVAGEKVYVEDYLNAGHIDTRAVQVSRARTMRSRPIVDPPWTVTHRFELLSDIIDLRELDPIAERAGRIVGVGDYRPRFGTFTATIEELP